jgi:NhaP-type Na+/H+ or K+/H+ antiporter
MAGTLVMTYYIRNKLSQQSTILVIVVIVICSTLFVVFYVLKLSLKRKLRNSINCTLAITCHRIYNCYLYGLQAILFSLQIFRKGL